ncbi:DUF1499 domain-containing protein [Seongchinamella sediminis]|uniref:DUF1499 domain-containing protein n=1 Tax=Seongchinamella sediminis TaxID=2283635 RepID=A0A3L7E2L5_9GAMM|nr:DUF1499 domain-containing protein [Seongchinamella sediminis]RLQ23796.1 DUF1499 domain-containing protein [Seongchinamella sediminis]
MTTTSKTPAVINWTGYLAITLLVAIPLAVLTVRSGAWQQGLLLYAVACAGSALALLLALLLMALPRYALWRKDTRMRALFAIPGTLLLLSLLAGRGDYPPIHNISTDLQNPPQFVTAGKVRGNASNSLALQEEVIEMQARAYPDLQTLVINDSIETAFERALATADELGWEVYHQDLNSGVIEAVDTTAIMGFKDDVVIRLNTNADGTLVDLRSVSRVGISDLGANAARIRAFFQAFKERG